MGPDTLPVVMQIPSDPLKFELLSMLGHPNVNVELSETQLEQSIRVTADFIAEYFPHEEKLAYFYTEPLKTTYHLPKDAYWVRDVAWHPEVTRIGDIFGAESFLFNVGNVTGIQNILTDYHLIQAYRKFASRILGTEGQWEVSGDNRIRLFPTPRGSFPVVLRYLPRITQWRSPQAREICKRMMLAEARLILGAQRSKFSNLPGPDGSSIQMDGAAMMAQGREEKKEALADAILLGEPLGIYLH